MSRNPYLAASRPTSSFTRSSRTSARSAFGSAGSGAIGSLGRSRSSANLSNQFSSATGGVGSGSYLSASSYVPSTWQRSSSSNRANTSNPRGLINSLGTKTNTNDEFISSGQTKSFSDESNYKVKSNNDSNRNNNQRSLNRSTSSKSLEATDDFNDDIIDESDSSHLKNYQQRKLQQPTPTLAPRTSTNKSLTQQPLDPDSNIANQETKISATTTKEETRRSTTSIDSLDNESSTVSIGDNIPSASARHLRSQGGGGGGQLLKSKSVELTNSDANKINESPILSSSMSVDRLILRAESMGERDLRKSFKELVMENERLKQQVKGFDDTDKQKQQEWIRKERQLQRKISELEEENKQIEHWKQEIQRLKEENSSLIRVVSKLTKR